MTIQELIRGVENCQCGRSHYCPVDHILIGSNVLAQIPRICSDHQNIMLVSDDNTWNACGREVHALLEDKVATNLILKPNGDVVIPNEEKIQEMEDALESSTDLIIGIGSGVINDLCKYVSFRHGLPYYIVATAPSMDGYVSVGCALILEGMKVTLNARPPKAVIADTAVLKNAPMDMLRAGYGDIIGKFSCLNDWKLSSVVNGEYFCQMVYDLAYNCAVEVSQMAEGVVARDEKTVGALMEALVIVGVAMAYVDCSRPASGSEHHLSHFFEITGILEDKPYFAHGIDVAYSAVVTAAIREQILAGKPFRRTFDKADWEANIRRVYGTSAEGVIALQNKLGWYEKDDSQAVFGKWEQIKAVLAEAPTAVQFREMVEKVGLPYEAFEKCYGKEKLADAILYAKDLKDRYTVLWLYDLYFSRKNIKLVAFDLDGTLTQHKSKLSEKHRNLLTQLSKKYKLLMVGAGTCRRVFDQMEQFPIDIIGNYGMQYCKYNPETKDLDVVRDIQVPINIPSIEERVTAMRQKYGFTDFAGDNVQYHPSGCITFPILGTAAKIEDKLAFDPDRVKRRAIYEDIKAVFHDYIVFVGGSSSFDMAPAPYDKAYALDLYCKEHGISHDEVVYVGDDYGPGGNDESVYLADFNFITVDDYLTLEQRLQPLL
ncbi:MAG: iron-containing alcohol dehydrogenase [Ruminococcaceae bacterium]|nr:iron-containing alcohol dehydrogenase [Oscillospiraceae bacterium]